MKNHRSRSRVEKDKKLRALYKEFLSLWDDKQKLGHWEEVDVPYRKGWVRFYVLHEKAKGRRDAALVEEILKHINTDTFSNRRDFIRRDEKKKNWIPIQQNLRQVSPKMMDNTPEWTNYFTPKISKYGHPFWEFTNPDKYFEFEIRPNYVTHHWIPNADVTRRLAELDNHFMTNNLWPEINRLHGYQRHYDYNYVAPRYKMFSQGFKDEWDIELDE